MIDCLAGNPGQAYLFIEHLLPQSTESHCCERSLLLLWEEGKKSVTT